jgi:predicted acyltransferase
MTNRAASIDLLRGFALLMMIFSGMIPFGDALPAWMYHAQVPPPLHAFNPDLAGLTWVDLVFPFFLFSMGAAVPFALPVKLSQQGLSRTLGELLRRSIRLLIFAIIGWNFHPSRLPTMGWWAQIAGILTYLGLFLAFFTFPNKTKQQRLITSICSAALLIGVGAWALASEKQINPATNDAIIRVLANVYFIGSIIWILTNGVWFLRLGFFLFFATFYIGALDKESWVGKLWLIHDMYNLVSPMLLKYLLIFLPGTIVGDILVTKFVKPRAESDEEVDENIEENSNVKIADFFNIPEAIDDTNPSVPSDYVRSAGIVYTLIALGATVATLWATMNRTMPMGLGLTLGIGFAGLVSIFILGSSLTEEEILSKPISDEQFIKLQLILFGFSMLIMGYFLDPFQGGVKKDHATLSYFFITSGLASLWILAFHHYTSNLLIAKILKPIERVGQNALMAYLMAGFLIVPLMNLSHFSELFIAPTPDKVAVFGVIKAVLITASVVGLTAFLSSRKIFWKI